MEVTEDTSEQIGIEQARAVSLDRDYASEWTEGVVTSVVSIPQDPATQWAILRRCPFGLVHLKAIIEALEEEQRNAASIRQCSGSGLRQSSGQCEDIQGQEQKDSLRVEEEPGGPQRGGLYETHERLPVPRTSRKRGRRNSEGMGKDASSRGSETKRSLRSINRQ